MEMNDKTVYIIIGGDVTGFAQSIAHMLSGELSSTEGIVIEGRESLTKEDLIKLDEILNNDKSRFLAPKEMIMELQAMPEMMQPIVLKDDKPSANMGAYRGYKSHPTKASDRKRFERFNKKRR